MLLVYTIWHPHIESFVSKRGRTRGFDHHRSPFLLPKCPSANRLIKSGWLENKIFTNLKGYMHYSRVSDRNTCTLSTRCCCSEEVGLHQAAIFCFIISNQVLFTPTALSASVCILPHSG